MRQGCVERHWFNAPITVRHRRCLVHQVADRTNLLAQLCLDRRINIRPPITDNFLLLVSQRIEEIECLPVDHRRIGRNRIIRPVCRFLTRQIIRRFESGRNVSRMRLRRFDSHWLLIRGRRPFAKGKPTEDDQEAQNNGSSHSVPPRLLRRLIHRWLVTEYANAGWWRQACGWPARAPRRACQERRQRVKASVCLRLPPQLPSIGA
jgi:hypothetical protein